jgi:hypothetical protein
VRLRDERYLFHLTPWVFFPLWLAAGAALGWLLEDAPLWLGLLIAAPVGWTMPFYVARMVAQMPFFARMAARRRSGTSRWGNDRPDERWH